MTFTTLTFLLFLLLVFAIYWRLRVRRGQNLLLLLASYVFYGWWDWRFCGLMLASSLLDYFVGIGLDAERPPGTRKMLLAIALVGNLGMLGFFKYFNFFTSSIASAAASLGWQFDSVTLQFVLPVGISFYTFQTMSYSIDIYRRQMPAGRDLIDYLAYVSFFPQLVAGPIERATRLLPQFQRERQFDYAQAVDGCRQMLWGFFKKMAIADNLAPTVDLVFTNPVHHNGSQLLVGTVFFAIQIYCDFSAYSDIASGTARLFGFELMKNFDRPYFAGSMREFWRRWHISLSTWFRDYVYLPLGGGRVSRGRQTGNIMATFVLSGLWHGASWNFAAWGALHGLAVLPEALASRKLAGTSPSCVAWLRPLRVLCVFTVVCLGWIFFRARTLSDSFAIITKVIPAPFQPGNWKTMFDFATDTPVDYSIFALLLALFLMEGGQRDRAHALAIHQWPKAARWATYFGVVAIVLLFGTHNNSPFIYFQF